MTEVDRVWPGVRCHQPDNSYAYIFDKEYEVIVDAPSHNEQFVLTRLFDAEAQIDELQRKVKELEAKLVGKADKPTTAADDFFAALPYRKSKKTPNQRRADVIKRAQSFVADKMQTDHVLAVTNLSGYLESYYPKHDEVEFVVNRDKRTVVALLKYKREKTVWAKAVAKCAPDDVFNADIGKAIALARVLNDKVPTEFFSAPKPTEVVVGMRVSPNDDGDWESFKVARIGEASGKLYDYDGTWIHQHKAQIIDDTEAQY